MLKDLNRLEKEFELAYDPNLSGSKVSRGYGMHIASGRDNPRKLQGDKYLADWFLEKRGINIEGKPIMNLHTIYCTATLQETEKYGEGNFDRISALRILMYYRKELIYQGKKVEKQKVDKHDSLFKTKLYA